MSLNPEILLSDEDENTCPPQAMSVTPLAQEGSIEWLCGQHVPYGDLFVLATAASEETVFQATQLLKNEFSLREKLAEPWALKPLREGCYQGRYALIYPSFPYRTLADALRQPPGTLHEFLELAARVCTPLGMMHQQGLVHGDIKPANLFLSPMGAIMLGGFGLASLASESLQQARLPVTGGTLAYMSPEHTSRTAHQVSSQSDLYSLGIVLYQLLTGSLPFGSLAGGHAEWAHHHIASEPVPPHVLRKDVPPVLSAILLRLLEKNPEARYQTAEGLLADLRRCQSNLQPDGNLAPFTLGLQDSQRDGQAAGALLLTHPQATEVLAAFDEVDRHGKPLLVVISGAPGSGKSSLMASSLHLLRQKKALLTVVKADQHSPILPYALFSAAFKTLALHLLGLPTAEVARWKTHITRLLGDHTGLAVSLVPELGVLLNRQANVPPEAHALDARDTFNTMACNLVNAFSVPGRPLVMLIDDVHWADPASLYLLQHLLSHHDDIPLLLVISHREESSLPCPLVSTRLTKIRAAAARVVDLTPEPLSIKAITRWLAGQLHSRASATTELAQLIHEKTGGIPLFTHEFYRQAVRDGLITHSATRWGYDREALRGCHYSENVASRTLQQLETIPAAARRLLGQVACIGGSGELAQLSRLLGLPVAEIRAILLPAVAARLITLTSTTYAFMHDRVHEAALGLIAAQEKEALHYQAAHRLAELANGNATNELLFRAVHHIAAIGHADMTDADRATFSGLILHAARRAKVTGDYRSALRFLAHARTLNAHASTDAVALMLEEAECEFLNGNFAVALGHCAALLAAPGELTDKAKAACLMAEVHMRQSDSQLALETALAWLAVFGIHLGRYPDRAECNAARLALQAQVGENPHTRFRKLPRLACRHTEAMMNLLASASKFAAFIDPRLNFIITCKILHLTLDHGITGASTFALCWYGALCGDHYHEHRRGFASALLARELVHKHNFTGYRALTLLPLDQISIWTMPVSYAIEQAKAAFDAAVEHGDRTPACLALRHIVMNYLARGDHLDGVQTSIERGLTYVRKAHYKGVEVVLNMQRDYVMFLRKPGSQPLSGHDFTPPTFRPDKPGERVEPLLLMQFWSPLYKGMAHFFAGEYAYASHCFATAAPLIEMIPGHIHMLDFHLYSALSIAIPLTPESCGTGPRAQIERHLEKIAAWAAGNPKTFADKEALLRAECLRLDGQTSQVAAQYEVAMALSREGQFHHIHGVACELAARFATACGLKFAAEGYLKGALHAWERWGAGAKVRQLEGRHPHLVTQSAHAALSTVTFEQSAMMSDLQSMATALRVLTEEIDLERLIHTLMVMLVERAGAQRCLLIRLIEGKTPEIEARAITTADAINVSVVKETPVATDLPLSVLAAVIRTGQEIRTGKPEVFSPFSQDHYLVASGAAVMCVPMFKQAQMVGVLYLENRLMPDVFTAEHSRIVSMLAAQAAVSLETARLYAELVDENRHRRRVEKQLLASQKSLMLGEKISHTGTWHWHLEQDVMLLSEEYRRIVGLPAHQNSLSMADFMTRVHPDDFTCINELVIESVRNGQPMQAEFRIIRTDGECRYIKGIGEPVENWPEVKEYFGTLSDITSQRMSEDAARIAQADLARVSRATTVGQLTASIAHEINQPLMSIVANAGASLRWLKRTPPHLENASQSLEEIIKEGSRAGDIIRGLQALTRNHVSEFTPAQLHLIARDILSLSRLELERKFISLELDLQASDDYIFCDRVQIQQVLLNLVVNAMEAMAENGGTNLLRLASFHPTPDTLRFEVSDSGPGISEEIMDKIFDSFYTTKSRGMGMGLTISSEIIHRHGGKLQVENREGGGSTFWFTLPRHNTSNH